MFVHFITVDRVRLIAKVLGSCWAFHTSTNCVQSNLLATLQMYPEAFALSIFGELLLAANSVFRHGAGAE